LDKRGGREEGNLLFTEDTLLHCPKGLPQKTGKAQNLCDREGRRKKDYRTKSLQSKKKLEGHKKSHFSLRGGGEEGRVKLEPKPKETSRENYQNLPYLDIDV